MFAIILVIHVITCMSLILVVLLQRGKGTGLGGVFGGTGGQSVFGSRGAATFLTKATSYLAVVFMLTSLSLALLSARPTGPTSAIEREMEQTPTEPGIPILPTTPPPETEPGAQVEE